MTTTDRDLRNRDDPDHEEIDASRYPLPKRSTKYKPLEKRYCNVRDCGCVKTYCPVTGNWSPWSWCAEHRRGMQ